MGDGDDEEPGVVESSEATTTNTDAENPAEDSETPEGTPETEETPDGVTVDPEEEGGRPEGFDEEERIRELAVEVSNLDISAEEKISIITETLVEDMDAETAEERRNVKAKVDEVVRGSLEGLDQAFEEARQNADHAAQVFNAENSSRRRYELEDFELYQEDRTGRRIVYQLGDLGFDEEGFMDSLTGNGSFEVRDETFDLFTDTTLERFSRLVEKGYQGREAVEELGHTIEMYDVGRELRQNLDSSELSSYAETETFADLVGRSGILYEVASDTQEFAQEKMDEETEKRLEAGERKFDAERGTDEFTRAKREEAKHKDDEENYRSDRDLLQSEMSTLVTETAESVGEFYSEELMFSDRLEHLSTEVEEFLGDDGLLDNIFTEYQKTVNDAYDDSNNIGHVENNAEDNLDLLYRALGNMKNRIGGPLADNEDGLLDNLWDAADSMLSVRSEFEEHEEFYDEVREESELDRYVSELETVTDRYFEVEGEQVTGYSDEVEELEAIVDTYEEGEENFGDEDLFDEWTDQGSPARPSVFTASDARQALTG